MKIDLTQPGIAEALAFSLASLAIIILAVIYLFSEIIHNRKSKHLK